MNFSSKRGEKPMEQQPERANVIKEEIVERDNHFLAVYIETQNSCLVMLSERVDKLGTMAIAVPKPRDLLGTASSSILTGDRFAITARLFAEHVAARKSKIAVVSVYLEQLTELQAQAYFMKLLDKILQPEAKAKVAEKV
jgi:hypothetical protein